MGAVTPGETLGTLHNIHVGSNKTKHHTDSDLPAQRSRLCVCCIEVTNVYCAVIAHGPILAWPSAPHPVCVEYSF